MCWSGCQLSIDGASFLAEAEAEPYSLVATRGDSSGPGVAAGPHGLSVSPHPWGSEESYCCRRSTNDVALPGLGVVVLPLLLRLRLLLHLLQPEVLALPCRPQ